MGKYRYWTFEEKLYVAKFYEYDGCLRLGDTFDVRHQDIMSLYRRIEKNGKLEKYKRYWDSIHKGG